MKAIRQAFTLELTTEELEIITRALRGECQFIKDDIETNCDLSTSDGTARAQRRKKDFDATKELRDNIGELIGHTFIGE